MIRDVKRWYEREHWAYAADRGLVEEYADWLKQIDWQMFCTFTFAWRVSDQQAVTLFDEFIDRLESGSKCDIGYVRGDEKRFSGCGKPGCPRHFHVLLACTAPIPPILVEFIWTGVAGRRGDGDSAQVRPYDASLNGAAYVMKLINKPEGDWAQRKLHLFLPSLGQAQMTARLRRHLRRHPALAQQSMGYNLSGYPMVGSGCIPPAS